MRQFYVEVSRQLVEEVMRKGWSTKQPDPLGGDRRLTMVEGLPPSAELIGAIPVEDASRARGLRSLRLLFQCKDEEAPCADGSCFNPLVESTTL